MLIAELNYPCGEEVKLINFFHPLLRVLFWRAEEMTTANSSDSFTLPRSLKVRKIIHHLIIRFMFPIYHSAAKLSSADSQHESLLPGHCVTQTVAQKRSPKTLFPKTSFPYLYRIARTAVEDNLQEFEVPLNKDIHLII